MDDITETINFMNLISSFERATSQGLDFEPMTDVYHLSDERRDQPPRRDVSTIPECMTAIEKCKAETTHRHILVKQKKQLEEQLGVQHDTLLHTYGSLAAAEKTVKLQESTILQLKDKIAKLEEAAAQQAKKTVEEEEAMKADARSAFFMYFYLQLYSTKNSDERLVEQFFSSATVIANRWNNVPLETQLQYEVRAAKHRAEREEKARIEGTDLSYAQPVYGEHYLTNNATKYFMQLYGDERWTPMYDEFDKKCCESWEAVSDEEKHKFRVMAASIRERCAFAMGTSRNLHLKWSLIDDYHLFCEEELAKVQAAKKVVQTAEEVPDKLCNDTTEKKKTQDGAIPAEGEISENAKGSPLPEVVPAVDAIAEDKNRAANDDEEKTDEKPKEEDEFENAAKALEEKVDDVSHQEEEENANKEELDSAAEATNEEEEEFESAAEVSEQEEEEEYFDDQGSDEEENTKDNGEEESREDYTMPSGRMSAYAHFVRDCREAYIRRNPDSSLMFAAFFEEFADTWRLMNDSEKKQFVDMAERDRKRCEVELADYRLTMGPVEASPPK